MNIYETEKQFFFRLFLFVCMNFRNSLRPFSTPARGLGTVPDELSQPTGYLRSHNYKK